jgi:hypothetical protein
MAWIKLRERDVYKTLKGAIDDALGDYWMTVGDMDSDPEGHAKSCSKLVLSSFKLLKYVRTNIGGVNWAIDDKKISNDVNDVCTDYYCLGPGESTSFQEESDALELLSRTAYREMKKALEPRCLWCGEKDSGKSIWCKNCGEAKDSLDKPREEWR